MPDHSIERHAILRAVFADDAPISRPDAASCRADEAASGHVASDRIRCAGHCSRAATEGNGTTIDLAKAILETGDDVLAIRTLAELGHVVPEFVTVSGTLSPGQYAIPAELREAFDFPESGVDASGRFEFRAEHLAILQGTVWRTLDDYSIDAVLKRDDFWPLSYIDGKRPYGECTYFQIDMAELLGSPTGSMPNAI
ncbi:hypothetical protein GPU89_24205 [Burkholderia cepacia]|nr:hypothetical protein [Burkholderia cepacia]